MWKESRGSLQGREAIDLIKESSKEMIEPFKSAIAWTPDDSRCFMDEMRYWVPIPVPEQEGRISLAGDAAHPMLPCKLPCRRPLDDPADDSVVRGQGLQHAIADAANYVEALLKVRQSPDAKTRRQVMAAYSAEVLARGGKAVRDSVEEGEKAFDKDSIARMLMVRKGHGRSV
jgi:2-polyprenyl-6-methoxyphenol hydroxylase-like FAD-dependent oxidoreductase